MLLRRSTRRPTTARQSSRQTRRRHFRAALEQLEDRSLMAAFTPGNLVIYRVGDGAAGLVNTGAAVFLDEFSPSGTLVQSVAMPTTANGQQNPLIASGTANSEGLLTRSVDGRYLVLPGYASTIPAASSLTSSTTVSRVIGRVDSQGVIDTTTDLADWSSGGSPRGVASTDGNDIWLAGAAGGSRYTTFGATTSTQLSTDLTNLRGTSIFNGQLYITTGSGTAISHVGAVGSGLPIASGQSISSLPGIPASGSQYGLFVADLSPAVPGADTMYVASDDAAALTKFSLVGSTWTSNGTVGIDDNYIGLTATVTGTTVTLYSTRKGGTGATGGGELVSLVDSSGYNGAFVGTPTLLATAAANTSFRGVALAPVGANTAPTVSDVLNQTTRSYEPTLPLAFTVGDGQTAPGSLTVTATSSDQALIPDANITIGGTGANRTITVRPGPVTGPLNGAVTNPATGTATITITVTDAGGLTATDTFDLTMTRGVTLDIGTATGNPGDTVQIPIRLNTNGSWAGAPLDSADLVIQYDTSILTMQPVAATVGADLAALPGAWTVVGNAGTGVDAGKLIISVSTQIPTSSPFNGVIAVINATINPAAPLGLSPINLVKTAIVNSEIKTTFVNEDTNPALLLGPNPTSSATDPISDGAVNVGNVVTPQSPVNTAPAGPVLGTEDTSIVFSGINALSVSDPNASDTLTTTLSVTGTTNGTFTGANGGGTAVVTGSGTSTLTIVGTQAQVNLALATVVFVPAANRNTVLPELPLVVTMNTTDGTTTPDTDTFNITLVETNDAPVPAADTLPAINEDAAPLVIPFATLLANDSRGAPNESTQTLTITGVSNPIGGTVNIVGTDVIFTPAANFNGAASFTYTVVDNGTNGGMPAPLPGSGGATVAIPINSVNDVPSFVKGADQTVAFNAPAQTVTGWATAISPGANETGQILTFNLLNNNNGLFAAGGQPAINATTGTLTFTPATGVFGTATVTVTLSDNGGTANGGVDTSPVQSFVITVNSPGNAPTISLIGSVTINEDASLQTVNFSGVTDGGDPQPQGITITASSNNAVVVPNPTVVYTSAQPSGSLTFTPVPNANGVATITVTVRDAGLDLVAGNGDDLTTTTTFTVTVTAVNDRPTFTAANPAAVNEDSGAANVPGFVSAFNPGPTDEALQTVLNYTVSNVTNPTLFAVAPAVATNGTLTYTPAANAFGTATFDLTVTDSGGTANGGIATSTTQTFTITVNSVNDAPTIAIGGNQTVANGAPAQTVNAFASVTSVGPSNETGQTVTYNVSNNNNGLFSVQPSISPTGVLTYTPAAGPGGTATVTVTGTDTGGTANGGANTSSPALTFTITLNAPLVNTLPTLNPVADLTINEGASLQTINLSGITDGGDTPPQALSVTASSSNNSLVPIAVNYTSPNNTGTLTFTSPTDGNGSSTITVTVRDSGLDLIPGNGDDGTLVRTFLVTVNPVNDAPSFTAVAPPSVNEDAGPQTFAGFITGFTAGPNNENSQTVAGYAVSSVSNPSLFSVQPTVNAAGQLSYTPAANAFGTSTFQVAVQDNGGTANGGVDTSVPQTFTITINSVNDAPSFAIGPNRTTPNTSGGQSFPGQASSISAGPANESAQTVTFQVANNNNPLFLVQPAIASSGTLTYTPAAGASGTATVTVTAHDTGATANGGVDTSASQTFTITILNNNPPTLSAIGNLIINQNSGVQTVNLSGITTGGESQILSVTASSSNTALIPTPSISYVSPNTTGTLNLAPAFNQVGTATITVTVRDAGFDNILNTPDDATTARTFTVQVNDVNDPPVANDQTIPAVLNTPVSGTLTATDLDGPSLTYSIFMAPALGSVVITNPSTGAFTYTPNPGATGLDIFTFRVTDGEFIDEGTVRIAIQGTQPVVTVSGGDLVVIGTPEPDMIIITHVAAGVVRVRTDIATAHYPVSTALIVNSGQGDDYVVVTGVQVPTTLDLAEGNDYASSGLQDDTIIGGAGDDTINASGGNNLLWGDSVGEQDLATGGKDILSSLDGNDVIYGGGQNDQIYSGDGEDYINAGAGDDVVSAGAGNDRVYGGAGADQLFGDEGNDLLSGGAGGDILVGRTGSDVLIGGVGADTLNGDDGSDLLFGNNTTNSASSTVGDTNDLALLAMLNAWGATRPSGLASSVSAGSDGSPDQLQGYTSDDDLYASSNDITSDFGLPGMGTDRFFVV